MKRTFPSYFLPCFLGFVLFFLACIARTMTHRENSEKDVHSYFIRVLRWFYTRWVLAANVSPCDWQGSSRSGSPGKQVFCPPSVCVSPYLTLLPTPHRPPRCLTRTQPFESVTPKLSPSLDHCLTAVVQESVTWRGSRFPPNTGLWRLVGSESMSS